MLKYLSEMVINYKSFRRHREMKKLQKEFYNFDDKIRIDGETPALINKRETLKEDIEEKFPAKCEKYGISVNKSDLRFILQGSYKISTTISNKEKGVDMDYAVILPLNINEYTDSRNVKKAARDALEISNVRIPTIKEPCVTVAYHSAGKETMHIDFPIYASYNDQLYLARGKENSKDYLWENADPEGLNNFFLEKFKDHPQLRRVVRYIKKWKQEQYNNSTNTHEVPPSIALTILACQNYKPYVTDGDDDLQSLYYTMKAILELFSVQTNSDNEILSANIMCILPVTPFSDVFYKMRNSSSHMITFYKRLKSAVFYLQEAVNLDEAHEAAKYVQKVLGSDFDIPDKQTSTASIVNKKEYSFG